MTAARRSVRFWAITLAAIATVAVTVSLGRWQLARAAQKLDLQSSIDARARDAVLDNAALRGLTTLEPLLHRRVVLRGQWAADRTVFLDNRQMNGRPGFYVVTPLLLEGAAGSVLVQRGWVARDFLERTRLPPVETPGGTVRIEGRVAPVPARLYALGDDKANVDTGASRIRQNLDLAAMRAETGLPLLEGSIVELGAASEGLRRQWPEVSSGVEKHYGYAAQWFGFATLTAILYVWFQFIAPRRRRTASR